MRAQRRDELRRVYREHVGSVYAFFAASVTGAHAEDLTSATFERVIKAWDRYDAARASERTWILTIARNLLTDHYRRAKHRDAQPLDDAVLAIDDGTSALSALELRAWLAELPERTRAVIVLQHVVGLSAPEVAELLELSVANVHQISSRGLRALREAAQQPSAGAVVVP